MEALLSELDAQFHKDAFGGLGGELLKLLSVLLSIGAFLALSSCAPDRSFVSLGIDTRQTSHPLQVSLRADNAPLASFTYPPGDNSPPRSFSLPVGAVVKVTASLGDDPKISKAVVFRAVEAYPFAYGVGVLVQGATIRVNCYEISDNGNPCPSP
jgi:hypothetical protein